jgi:hypothetical protein
MFTLEMSVGATPRILNVSWTTPPSPTVSPNPTIFAEGISSTNSLRSIANVAQRPSIDGARSMMCFQDVVCPDADVEIVTAAGEPIASARRM